MDWDNVETKKDDRNIEKNSKNDQVISSTAIDDAVEKHFEESLKNLKLEIKNDAVFSKNSCSSDKTILFDKKIQEPINVDMKTCQSVTDNDISDVSLPNVNTTIVSKPDKTERLSDPESISSILKTFQHNSFINSSILKLDSIKVDNEIKNISSQNKNVQFKGIDTVMLEPHSNVRTVLTDVDIEAELPCTSIQLKKKQVKPRKKLIKKENEIAVLNRALKPCSKRSTKRKTNYRETSSDEEPKFQARRRTNNRSPKSDFKKISEESPTTSNVSSTVKSELEIKKDFLNSNLLTKSPNGFNTIKALTSKTNSESKTEQQNELNTENGIVQPNDVATNADTQTKSESSVYLNLQSNLNKENTDLTNEEEEENENDQKQRKRIKTSRRKKPKKMRFSSLAAVQAARNRTRLHPLTRQEQQMMNQFMETQEPFLQKIPCLKLSSKISKCRECRHASMRSDSTFCRFYDFRRLRYKDKGVLIVDGFSDPNKDPGPSDIETWMLGPPPKDIDLDISRYIIMHVGDQFCRIWQDEQTAAKEHMSPNKTIAWKKAVKGVREICDVCEATLFNFHWTCEKCGFGVCLDCYRDRKYKKIQKTDRPAKGLDEYGWLACNSREAHEMIKLMLTQIIPGNALNFLAQRLHQACKLWKIPQKCGCSLSTNKETEQFAESCIQLADKAISDSYLRFYSRECEIKYLHKIKVLNPNDVNDNYAFIEAETQLIEEASAAGTLPTILATTLKHLKLKPSSDTAFKAQNNNNLKDEVTKEFYALKTQRKSQKSLPQKVMTLGMSKDLFPGIAHDWLCNGKLLRLLESRDSRNTLLFKEFWKRGQPIMVSGLCKLLNIKLWHPEAFCADFGEKKNDLINCMTGNLVPNQPMKYFWEGFQCVSKRLLDASGQPMLLKLKDWPPGDDFAEILPTRFKDLMNALPLPEYTLRTGGLNIASRLPSIFVPPDLGPKMYNAYGSALHPDKGTTNLHLDISDAVNIMVYVGIPTDESAPEQIKAALRAIDSGGCDILTRRRVRQPGVMPGALWHIYSARDADKIRDLLNRVTIERGYRLEPDHDPIHDQNWYLDNELRERLYDDYGVEGYPIAQCLGDAVFIPAGAPHQVRNLHNCIKVAEDFVSPENIQHCFHLSQQFRKLSMSHTNHEDKLQIRNVIYHSIKDTTAYLTYLLNQIM